MSESRVVEICVDVSRLDWLPVDSPGEDEKEPVSAEDWLEWAWMHA